MANRGLHEKIGPAKIISELRPQIDKLGGLIAANAEAPKDSKTKKEHKKGSDGQKKEAELELATLDKKMEAAPAGHAVGRDRPRGAW